MCSPLRRGFPALPVSFQIAVTYPKRTYRIYTYTHSDYPSAFSGKGCRYSPLFMPPFGGDYPRRAFTLTRRLQKQGFAGANILTRSRHKRSIQPVYVCAAASGVCPCFLSWSPGFCGGTAQQGAAFLKGECYVPFHSG